jgi:hypothetical protein
MKRKILILFYLLFLIISFSNCNKPNAEKEKQTLGLLAYSLSSRQTTTASITCNAGTTCSSPPCLNICFRFNSSQDRLGNTGQIANIPTGNAGQNPDFKLIAAHYYELAQNANTALGSGTILFQPTTVTDTSYPTNDVRRNAFNFADLNKTKEYDVALSVLRMTLDETKINQVIKEYSEDFDKNAIEYNKKNKYTIKDYKYKSSTKENFKDRVLKAIDQKVKELQSESCYLNN